jgi:hypothetical protein
MKKPAPWPAPGDGPARGPLSADHADEHIARVFRPRDLVTEEIELGLERIRIDQDNYRLKREVERLARDRAELDDLAKLAEQLKRPEPKPQPEPHPITKPPRRQRGRPPEREANKEMLRDLRARYGGLCRDEFCAEFARRRGKGRKVSDERAARVYNTAHDDLEAETSE